MIHRLLKRRFQDARSETIWLTVYADLITNLMLVFLALYGLTIMGSDAMTQALQSMKLGDIKVDTQQTASLEFDKIIPVLQEQFLENPEITISQSAGSARIEFGEKVLFDSGGATIKASGLAALLQVANILNTLPYTVVVEGHTDNVPLIKGSSYKDNRELSLARAMAVVNLMTHQGQIQSAQMAAAAYGAYKPRASNDTEDGRRMNRRVEIALFKDFPFGEKPVAEVPHG